MMYVVKIGEYYVREIEYIRKDYTTNKIYLGGIVLSREIMRNFEESMAKLIAEQINGEVILIEEEVSND